MAHPILFSLIASGALAGFAAWRRALTPGGLALAGALALVICYCGGWAGYLALVATFCFTVAAGKISGARRERVEQALHAKTGRRDAAQIFCNVFVGALMLLLWRVTCWRGFLWAYGGAMAAALADSMASELGVLSKRPPRDILTLKPVTPGLSGGVTALGFAMSALGAALVAACFAACTRAASGAFFPAFLDVTAAGFFAALCDSALGSGVQVKYRCPACSALTEKPVHCSVPGVPERGLRFMTNDAVNLCNNLLGAAAAAALYAIHS
ncbi:MAG: DUF92 domain-containing protein [Ruminococcaceae bacterium]|nr:DUF92 domain-containing protein [Oscillospiraceae bacterium]